MDGETAGPKFGETANRIGRNNVAGEIANHTAERAVIYASSPRPSLFQCSHADAGKLVTASTTMPPSEEQAARADAESNTATFIAKRKNKERLAR